MTVDQLLEALSSLGVFEVVRQINELSEPTEAAELYLAVIKKVYWTEQGAGSLAILGSCGIQYCLLQSQALSSNPTKSLKLKKLAQILANDLATNTWPGWGDPGVVIHEGQLWAGFQASRLNLKLCQELAMPSHEVASAYWLLGVHHLAGNRFGEAKLALRQALDLDHQDEDEIPLACHKGYLALVEICMGESEHAEKSYTESLDLLEVIGTGESETASLQLQKARLIFEGRS